MRIRSHAHLAPVLLFLVQCCLAHGRHLVSGTLAQDDNTLTRDSGAGGLQHAGGFGVQSLSSLRLVSGDRSRLEHAEVAEVGGKLPQYSTMTYIQSGTHAFTEPEYLGQAYDRRLPDGKGALEPLRYVRNLNNQLCKLTSLEHSLCWLTAYVPVETLTVCSDSHTWAAHGDKDPDRLQAAAAVWTSDEAEFIAADGDDDGADYMPGSSADDGDYTTSAYSGESDHLEQPEDSDPPVLRASPLDTPPALYTTTTATTTAAATAYASSGTQVPEPQQGSGSRTRVHTATVYSSQARDLWRPQPDTLESLEKEVHLRDDGEVEFGDDFEHSPAVDNELQEDYPM